MKDSITHDKTWDAFKDGDMNAFSEIYRENAPMLLNYGFKVCADKFLVQDSIQDLFADLWHSRKQLSRTTSVKFYLFKALRNKIFRNKKISHSDEFEPIENYMSLLKNSSPEDHCIELEVQSFQMKHLRDTLERLPSRQREAINLRYFQNFSNEEIAGIMGISYPAACKFIYAGLKKLTKNLKLMVMEILIVLMFTFQ